MCLLGTLAMLAFFRVPRHVLWEILHTVTPERGFPEQNCMLAFN